MSEQLIRFFVEDGSTARAYDRDLADQIKVPKGSDSSVVFDVSSVSGVPLDLSEQTVTISVKKRPTDTIDIVKINSVPLDVPSKSSGKFLFSKSMWDYAAPGLYVYSITATDAFGVVTSISPIRIFHLWV